MTKPCREKQAREVLIALGCILLLPYTGYVLTAIAFGWALQQG